VKAILEKKPCPEEKKISTPQAPGTTTPPNRTAKGKTKNEVRKTTNTVNRQNTAKTDRPQRRRTQEGQPSGEAAEIIGTGLSIGVGIGMGMGRREGSRVPRCKSVRAPRSKSRTIKSRQLSARFAHRPPGRWARSVSSRSWAWARALGGWVKS
jgi:hypothetical protein